MEPENIRSLERLDDRIAWVDASGSAKERQGRLEQFFYSPDIGPLLDSDPFSRAYQQEIYRIYNALTETETYVETDAEANRFDLEQFKVDPYPFVTKDPRAVGEHLAAAALIVRDFPKPSGARILEMGPGCGNLTLTLARTGYHVTGLDLEPRYLELINHWAEVFGVSDKVTTVEGTFSDFDLPGPFDAVMFFESFHHCVEHVDLLRKLRGTLAPDGVLCFFGEPIEKDFDTPWRLRTDSLAAYYIRTLGWMELGFREDYFVQMLYRTGFVPSVRTYVDCKPASGFVAHPFEGVFSPNEMYLLDGWHAPDIGAFRWTSGPASLDLPETAACITLRLINHRPEPLPITCSLAGASATRPVSSIILSPGDAYEMKVPYGVDDSRLLLELPVWSPSQYGSPDPRQLGVAVEQIEISTAS